MQVDIAFSWNISWILLYTIDTILVCSNHFLRALYIGIHANHNISTSLNLLAQVHWLTLDPCWCFIWEFPCFNNCCANIFLGICVGAICRFPGLLVFTADKFSQFGEVGALAAVSDVAVGEEAIALRGGMSMGGECGGWYGEEGRGGAFVPPLPRPPQLRLVNMSHLLPVNTFTLRIIFTSGWSCFRWKEEEERVLMNSEQGWWWRGMREGLH